MWLLWCKGKTKKSAWLSKSHCMGSILTNNILGASWGKVLYFAIQRSLTLRGATTSGFGPNTFFLCLPGDHWIWLHWSVSVPFEELPNGCHAKQHNQPRHSVCMKYIGYAPTALPSQQNSFTVLKSCSYFHVSHNSPPVSLSAALSCSTFSFPVLFASVLHAWARVSAPCSRGQANSLLLYLFLNPITQSDWDCPSVNGMGILREIVWSNNKPTCRGDKSIFKVLRSSRTTVQMCITFFFFFSFLAVLPHSSPSVLHLIVIILYFRHTLWLITLLPRRRDHFNL